MRKLTTSALCISCVFLASLSPLIVSLGPDYTDAASRHGLFYNWFYRLPIAIDQWVWPEGDGLMLGLAVAVYAVQYGSVTAAALVVLALIRRVTDALLLEAAHLAHRSRAAALQHSSRKAGRFISES